ncbi:1-acyl-sn-glycerol-3-phosphate acyltransferase [bioreactor metagenome]|uniref:1-acyl-sn-glycerol-3-phosphate acyltransferase n=1 Tax=bioreactor metagenome TaxID=1076179 RepID=A0A645GQI6_9ZZZZ
MHPCRVIGRGNIPEGGALVCANHTRLTDPLLVIFAFRLVHQFRFMAKAELLRVPVLGRILKAAGVFGVERGKSDVGAIKTAIKVLRDGGKLLMFPEGTRQKDGESGEAKTGAAMLALRTGVPIVPVYVPPKKNWFRPTTVVIGQPYYPQTAGPKPNSEDYRAVADDLMTRIGTLGERVTA